MLPLPDLHHLRAAQGWIELGNFLEANEELEKITPGLRTHPDVLELRYEIFAHATKWVECLDIAHALVKLVPESSFGWIRKSFALHELKRTQEALDELLPVVDKFPKEWVIPYNLCCYCAQIGKLDECEQWFKKAILIDEKAVQHAGIDDPDLKPLWDSMSTTIWKRPE